MSISADWLNSPFFDEPAPVSLDGGTTSHGVLWHAVSPRWGHSMHPMCSYQGMFPAKLVHYFVQAFTRPGDLVADPFSGRGTTVLQARAEGRRTAGSDLSPLAHVLTSAKAFSPSWERINEFVEDLEANFRHANQLNEPVSDDIAMLFHPHTLKQLQFIRRGLLRRALTDWSPEEYMLAAAIAGILHGNHRADGSSAYLSISMPNTFSMPPSYVSKFIAENGLEAPEQDVFKVVRDKLARLYLDALPDADATTALEDAADLGSTANVEPESVDLIVTSPPYLKVVNYGTSNWIRLWWLGLDDVSRNAGVGRRVLDAELDHRHGYVDYKNFMLRVFQGIARALRPDGVAAVVIGDVARPNRDPIPLAERVWDDVGARSGLELSDVIIDELGGDRKVSRIWGDTRGQATECDRILILGRSDGEPRPAVKVITWDEPYKDCGPDAAHARVR